MDLSDESLTSHDADVAARLRLDGKVAIVTGGTRGIGLAITTTLARAGAQVMIASRKAANVESAVRMLRAEGCDVAGMVSHLGRPTDARELAARTVERFDGIDIIVNNAATNPVFGPLQHAAEESFDKVFSVNVKGPLELCRTSYSVMAERGGGAVLNIASTGGVTPEPGLGLYSMSKAALISMTKVMAQEWGADGIRANAICPGLIKTHFSQMFWQDPDMSEQMLGRQPIRRIGEPADVAGLALFLVSDAAAYCTGGVYNVDGGNLM